MPALEGGRILDRGVAVQEPYDAVEQRPAAFGVRDLAPSENDRNFNAVFLLEELFNVAYLKFYIVGFDFCTYFDFFYQAAGLPFTRFFLPLALFVKVLAEIHYPTNRRSCRGGYFDEV